MAVQVFGKIVARDFALSIPGSKDQKIAEKDWADIRADAVHSDLLADLGRLARGYELSDCIYCEEDIDIILNSVDKLAKTDGESSAEQHLQALAQKVSGELGSAALLPFGVGSVELPDQRSA